ncbi:MAG TPA: VWA domain-containing protein [Thermoanaerobaculia bacterium]|nr:VWA domain-containing protein [Thermoanaerobaculia bacterium]
MATYRRVLSTALLLAVLGGVGFVVPGAAQRPEKPKAGAPPERPGEDIFLDTVNVSVVNVDVYVTDKSGNRVTGLTQKDFEIYENGKPMAITNFYAIEGGKVLAGAEDVAPAAPEPGTPPPPPGVANALQRAPIPDDQRLRLVVYIDNFALHPFNRNRVMRELRVFLDKTITRDDQVMLVTYDRSLKVRRNFTSDPDLINAGLLELEKVTGHAVHSTSERRDVLRNIEESRSPSEAMGHARMYAQSVYNDLSFSIDSLKNVVSSLAGMPGRKAVLYVSEGIPMIAGQDVFFAVQEKFGQQTSGLTEAFQYDASRRFTELANQANANRITFYSLDAAGLRTYNSVSAENQGPGMGIMVESMQISNMQASMQYLAEKTGGTAILNSNVVLPQLEKLARDFNTYYSLGYSPPHYGDGRYYKVEVKVKGRKGLTVRHREGYRDKSADARMTDGTVATLHFPYEENPIGVDLVFGTPTQRSDGYYLVPVEVKIPLDKLTLVPREASHEGRLRLFIGAMDSDGDASEVQQTPLSISIPAAEVATATGKNYVYQVSLLMRGGEHRVGLGVRDDLAGQASFLSRGLRVGGRASR